MALKLNIELTNDQKSIMASIPPKSWFTNVIYLNALSPIHPDRRLDENNEMKQAMVNDLIKKSVEGKRVLDLFCGNGAFAIIAALSGAKEVIGIDFSDDRIKCAKFIANTIKSDAKINFMCGDVYKITDYFNNRFDVVLCFGGLYHIADPAYVLQQIHELVKEKLILQTSQVLPLPINLAKFIVRKHDLTQEGKYSIRKGYGTWHLTPGCIRELLLHGGFKVMEERRPPLFKRFRFPWYIACCKPL
jgi:SAM-dependent methyltransferase